MFKLWFCYFRRWFWGSLRPISRWTLRSHLRADQWWFFFLSLRVPRWFPVAGRWQVVPTSHAVWSVSNSLHEIWFMFLISVDFRGQLFEWKSVLPKVYRYRTGCWVLVQFGLPVGDRWEDVLGHRRMCDRCWQLRPTSRDLRQSTGVVFLPVAAQRTARATRSRHSQSTCWW